MQEGFVKLPRDIINWRWFADANVLKVYIYLMLNAAFKPTEWKTETLQKGQLITGRKELAQKLKMTESQIRTALSKLQSTGEISIKATNKYSVVTLLKWEKTQGDDYFFANKSPTNNQQAANKSPQYKNVNNLKNVKNNSARPREKKYDIHNGSIDWSQVEMLINN